MKLDIKCHQWVASYLACLTHRMNNVEFLLTHTIDSKKTHASTHARTHTPIEVFASK